MATWTELLDPRDAEVTRVLPAAELRELLADLPHHPNICRVVCVTLTLDTGARVKVGLDTLAPGERMASGASGPITPGAGVQRDTVQPWRVTPVLGDAGTAPEPEVVTLAQEFTPPAVTTAQPFALSSAGWLDGIKWHPPGETTKRLAEAGPLIILPGDA